MFALTVIDSGIQGVVLYRGKSLLNGKPIVVVATGLHIESKNGKTGEMVQVYILSLTKPTTAVYNGDDEAVCGDCILRYVDGTGACYCNPAHGALGVYRGLSNNKYPDVTPAQAGEMVRDRVVRLGAYGDPAAVPISVWDELLKYVAGWTGYTHQWRKKKFQELKRYCMASCEIPAHRIRAQELGWRTYRIREDEDDELMPGEFVCPAQHHRRTCDQCKACDGGNAMKASPAIIAHGTPWKVKRLKKLIRLMKNKKKYRIKW